MVVKLSEPKVKLKKAFWLSMNASESLSCFSLALSLFRAQSYVRAEQCTEVFIALKEKKSQHMLTSDGCTSCTQ